jgi:hypothetical protein
MINAKPLLFIFILLLIPMSCFADTVYGTVGKQATLTADIFSGASYYAASAANISIYAPNLSLSVNNKAMTSFGTGKFYYNYTPNISGEYYVSVTYFNSSGLIATASSQLEVQNPQIQMGDNNMGLGIIIALGLCAAVCLVIAYNLEKEHIGLKLLLILISLTFLILLGSSSIENDKVCGMIANGNTLTTVCNASNNTTPQVFYYVIVSVYVLFLAYLIIYFAYYVLMWFKSQGSI